MESKWTVVKNSRYERSERCFDPVEEGVAGLGTDLCVGAEHLGLQAKESNDYSSLVGAPLKLAAKQVPSVPPLDGLKNKIGEGFYLRARSSDYPVFTECAADFDLCDTEGWPSVGPESASVLNPQLPSWSTAVKKPPPPVIKQRKEVGQHDQVLAAL
jgi:hypothetical protein